jgi:hypothetical protein
MTRLRPVKSGSSRGVGGTLAAFDRERELVPVAPSDPSSQLAAVAARGRPDRRVPGAALVPLCYLLAAILLTWRLWADPASRVVAGNPHDADLFAWFMRYAATAVRHGRLPALVTTGMNAPTGVNLMWNTPLLLPAVLLAPVTGLFGPQVSLTILTTAGFAGSATALYWVLRRWRISTGAAALAGAVYGFSPALLQTAMSHYNLQLVILPPLIIDASLRLAIGGRPGARPTIAGPGDQRDRARSRRWPDPVLGPVSTGAWLGLLMTAQLFISEEIALSTALTGVLMIAVVGVSRPRAAVRRIGPAAGGLLVAVVVTAALAGHALVTQFRGPLTQHGPLYPLDYYVNDLTSFVTPQGSLLFHSAASAAAAAGYQGGLAEYLGYLGWPLIVLLALAGVLTWHRLAGRAAAVTTLALLVLSLGGHPLIGGKEHSAVNLPWHWLEELPVISTALPDRLSILADGAAAVLLAVAIDEVGARLTARRLAARPEPKGPDGTSRPDPLVRRVSASVLAVAVIGCLPLLPRPLPAQGTLPLPAGWQTVLAGLHLRSGTRVLAVPVTVNYLTPTLRWTADVGEPTVMVGGYFIGPGTDGQAYINGTGIKPTAWYLDQLWAAGLPPGSPYVAAAQQDYLATGTASGPATVNGGPDSAQVQADLASWRPQAIVADATVSSPLGKFLIGLFGRPTVAAGGVLGWRR